MLSYLFISLILGQKLFNYNGVTEDCQNASIHYIHLLGFGHVITDFVIVSVSAMVAPHSTYLSVLDNGDYTLGICLDY